MWTGFVLLAMLSS